MFKVNSKIKIKSVAINRLTKAGITALEETGEALHTEVVQAEVIPRETGALGNEKMSVDYSRSNQGIVSIVHEGPYARRLYFHPEYNFSHDNNRHAKGKWFEDWQRGGQNEDFAQKMFAKYYKAEAKL